MKTIRLAPLLVLLALAAGAAFGQETFRIAIGVDPDTLDPVQGTTTTVDNVLDYVVEPLAVIDESGGLVPRLATSWTVADDGLSIDLELRRGVTFHDGTPFDADAAIWNVERVLDPEVRVPRRGPFSAITSVEATGTHAIRVNLAEPAPYMMGVLAQTLIGMMSPASVDIDGNSYQNITVPIGTGPYTYSDRTPSERVVVDRYDGYWGEMPYYERVIFQIVPEATTRESLLLAGQVDLIILPPTSDIPALQANPRTEVVLGPSNRTIYIVINNDDPVLQDRRVRQALNYAVDKEAIVQGILFGAADPMDAPMADSLFGYTEIGAYPYDPERASELLAEAGVEPGELSLDFIAPTGRYVQDFAAAQAIANFLRDVGIDTEVRTMDWPSYVGSITQPPASHDLQLHLLGWAPSFMDASQQMQQFDSAQHPPNGLVTSFYDNEEVDRLVAEANQEVDEERRAELYAEASRLIWEDAPWIFLWVQRFPMVHSSEVSNVRGLPNEKFYAIYARPAE
jgi:ABC-type transport system substrate-binding protein